MVLQKLTENAPYSVQKRITREFYRGMIQDKLNFKTSIHDLKINGLKRSVGFNRLDVRRVLAINGNDTFALGHSKVKDGPGSV
jgi:hypothetical protein